MLPKPESNVLPKPTSLDIEIAYNKGTSIVVKVTKESLQVSKSDPTPSLLEIIK